MLEKIIEFGLKTYSKEVCCSIRSPIIPTTAARRVAQAVKEIEGKAGAPIAIKGFVRYALGEGIEKQTSDFAAEVAAAVKG